MKLYPTYRKLRFLARRGTLFSVPGEDSATKDISGAVSWILFIQSLAIFLIAYFVIFSINLFITGIAANISHIPVVLYYSGPDFLIRGRDWTIDSIKIVFSSGPLFMFVTAVSLVVLYIMVSAETGILRLFLLWAMYYSITRTFGELLVGALMSKGLGFVIIYMFIMDTGKLIIAIFTLIFLLIVGLLLARQALLTANIYFNYLRASDRKRFINRQFVWPFLTGMLLINLISLPHTNSFEIGVLATMSLLILPFSVISKSNEDLYFDEEPRKLRLNPAIILTAILVIVIFRVVFAFGIRLVAV